jgi:aromatic ring-opening dioxygenase catalytic subunit (LigB family)
MGAIVAAGLLSHVPGIMLPEAERRSRYAGRDTSFPQALREIYRERIQPASFDTFIIFDTHWFTTRMAAHSSPDPAHVSSDANRAYDEKIIELLKRGEHASVIKLVPDFRATCSPEGFFAHYSMLAGALGGEACSARAAQYGEYENAIGTGQAMLWFPL